MQVLSSCPYISRRIMTMVLVQVETHECMLEENGVRLALTVVDTPGYGDAVDNT